MSTQQTSLGATWTASSDANGVSGYHAYRNGTSVGTTAATNYTFGGLACGTSYTLAVDAYDAAGNISSKASMSATTAACSTPPPAPTAPSNTALPAVSGTAQVGQTLTATPGTWSGNPTTFAYQWQRCDAAGASCASIAGATSQTYVPVDSDAGSTLRVAVTARTPLGTATATSAPTAVVSPPAGPTNTSPPTISGTAQQGQTLTATTGSWTGNPTSFSFQWQRCDAGGASCVAVTGATAGTYVPAAPDVGSTIRVAVTARNAVGETTAVSAPTAVVS
jgi:chitodextrinase